jgi:hypothetical protein
LSQRAPDLPRPSLWLDAMTAAGSKSNFAIAKSCVDGTSLVNICK